MPDDPYPICWIPMWAVDAHGHAVPVLDYRWGLGSPEHRQSSALLVQSYDAVERHMRGDLGCPQLESGYQSRWDAIGAMVSHITRSGGLLNPLIVVRAVGQERYWVAVGNQRLCALRVLGWRMAPCRVVTRWADADAVQRQHPYKPVEGF